MQTLDLHDNPVEGRHARLSRPEAANGPWTRVEGVVRGLVRHRAKRSGAHPAMTVEDLVRLRSVLDLIAGASGGVLGAALVPSRARGGVTRRPKTLRFVTLSAMDVTALNHYLRRIA